MGEYDDDNDPLPDFDQLVKKIKADMRNKRIMRSTNRAGKMMVGGLLSAMFILRDK